MAAALKITPEWLSKIINGHVTGSDDIGLRLDVLLRERGLVAALTFSEVSSTSRPPGVADESIEQTLRRDFEILVAAAAGDRDRLGWVRVQLDQMRAFARTWVEPDEINRRATQRAKQMSAAAEEHRASVQKDTRAAREA